jgi:glutaminyl-peptide cyclotransferase
MRIFRVRQPAAVAQYLGYAFLALAGLGLLLSCSGSPPPAEPVATVSAQPSVTQDTFDSPVPTAALPAAVVNSPVPTAVAATVKSPLPTATRVPPPVETPDQTTSPADSVPVCTVRVMNTFPHDRAAFTQGLVFENGMLYEGTGLNGQSTLRRVELQSGEVLQSYSLPSQYFGEGITIWEDRIVQPTWKSGMGFVYDKETFELLDTFRYPTQGWGITHDGFRLIMSDGTSTLHFWDPGTFAETGSVEVYSDVGPVTRLNELEYIEGMVFANVWRTDLIAIIDPDTGRVTAWIDLKGLLKPEDLSEPVDVLNGIAYDVDGERLFVTGKLWPKVFEIELISPDGLPAPVTCRQGE